MKTYLDCIPCFFRQLLQSARTAGLDPVRQKSLLESFAKIIPELSLRSSPPAIARLSYNLLKESLGGEDPYKDIKAESNRLALELYPELKEKVNSSPDRLLESVELAIAGNIIDFGVKNNLNVDRELKRILLKEEKSVRGKGGTGFHYPDFTDALEKSRVILYLADNAGEIVFDRLLLEEIISMYPDKVIYFAVKERPVINDALIEDAVECGIDRVANVISNGSDAPGTILSLCSEEFIEKYREADMIISKGQGNFESLSEETTPIFFLFMVKCPVVVLHTGANLGDILLLYNKNKQGLTLRSYPAARDKVEDSVTG